MAERILTPGNAVSTPAAVVAAAGGTSPLNINPNGNTTPAPTSNAPKVTTAVVSDTLGNTRTAQSVPIIIPAATLFNGQVQPAEIPLVVSGEVFYLRAANGQLAITAFRGGATGTENTFGVGQGREVSSGFENIIVRNYNLFPVVGLLWVGWDNFINNQLIIDQQNTPNIAFPTYPIPNAATTLNITDRSGTSIQDIDGKTWLALYRVAIQIFNLDQGNTYLLYRLGGSPGSPAIAAIPLAPLPIRLDISGSYTISVSGGINMIVSEIYQCIDPSQ